VDKRPNGSVIDVNAFDEYGYDGEEFIAFNFSTMQWMEKNGAHELHALDLHIY
ncbi:hypothetical protein M9458_038998, partial [Cirrhinus mrigala]